MSVQGSGFIHFLAVMAALGYLMDSLFSEALVSMVMQSATGPVLFQGGWAVLWTLYPLSSRAHPECEPVGKALPQ